MPPEIQKRRKRTISQPLGTSVLRYSDRELRLLRFLRLKGPLPTPLSFEVWRGGEDRSYEHWVDRQRVLFHESSRDCGPILIRPDELNPSYAVSEPIWCDGSDDGFTLLDESEEFRVRYSSVLDDHEKHRGMGACLSASFRALAPAHNIVIRDREEIFAHPNCPESTRLSEHPLELTLPSGRKIVPDDLESFEYVGRGFCFYPFEWDRATTTQKRVKSTQKKKTLFDMYDRYIEMFETTAYYTRWGIRNVRAVLIGTTAPGRMEKSLRYLADKPFGDRFYFRAFPTFGAKWRTPRGPLEVFGPWLSTKGLVDISKPPPPRV